MNRKLIKNFVNEYNGTGGDRDCLKDLYTVLCESEDIREAIAQLDKERLPDRYTLSIKRKWEVEDLCLDRLDNRLDMLDFTYSWDNDCYDEIVRFGEKTVDMAKEFERKRGIRH